MRSPYSDVVDFGVLGALRVEGASGRVEVRGAKERLLLARLVAARGRTVPTSELIDTLWGEEPPRSAAKSLQTFVARLRAALAPHTDGASVIVTEGAGYRLAVDPAQVDAERFLRLADLGRAALADGHPASAHRNLEVALALWRGPAYADLASTDALAAEAARLEERRLTATEDLLAALLELGREHEAVPDLEAMVRRHPLRERGWELLVAALYRAGRQGDALAAYERARVTLADALGVDPGPGLRAVHARVLAHDPTLSNVTVGRVPPELCPPPEPPGLVGRDRELQRLRELWHAAGAGPPATVVVRGPRGAGATALAATLAAEVAREGGHIRCVRAGTPPSTPGSGQTVPTLLVADHVDPGPSGPTPTLTLRLVSADAPVPGERSSSTCVLSSALPSAGSSRPTCRPRRSRRPQSGSSPPASPGRARCTSSSVSSPTTGRSGASMPPPRSPGRRAPTSAPPVRRSPTA